MRACVRGRAPYKGKNIAATASGVGKKATRSTGLPRPFKVRLEWVTRIAPLTQRSDLIEEKGWRGRGGGR